jgi:hypothetical protein
MAVDDVGRYPTIRSHIQGSTRNHENEEKIHNLVWMLCSVYAVDGVYCTRCVMFSVYAVLSVHSTRCEHVIMALRNREG